MKLFKSNGTKTTFRDIFFTLSMEIAVNRWFGPFIHKETLKTFVNFFLLYLFENSE